MENAIARADASNFGRKCLKVRHFHLFTQLATVKSARRLDRHPEPSPMAWASTSGKRPEKTRWMAAMRLLSAAAAVGLSVGSGAGAGGIAESPVIRLIYNC
jgi:hypothetical protein